MKKEIIIKITQNDFEWNTVTQKYNCAQCREYNRCDGAAKCAFSRQLTKEREMSVRERITKEQIELWIKAKTERGKRTAFYVMDNYFQAK